MVRVQDYTGDSGYRIIQQVWAYIIMEVYDMSMGLYIYKGSRDCKGEFGYRGI